MVIWITGLSGAGKSTISVEVVRRLRMTGRATVLLDGDQVRAAISACDTGYDADGRLRNAYRMSRLALLISSQGIAVVVATMSLFHEVHEWNRAHLPGYFEVFLDVPMDVLRKRHPRGLYNKEPGIVTKNVVGIDIPFDIPNAPNLRLDNSIHLTNPECLAEIILNAILFNDGSTLSEPE